MLNLNYLPLEENVILALHEAVGKEIYSKYPSVKTCRFIDKNKKTLSLGFCSQMNPLRGVLGYFVRPLYRELQKNKDFDVQFITGDESFASLYLKQIDILIDLNGHTHRQEIGKKFNDFHAPVQITWLGYPNTTGLKTMDYRLVSDTSDLKEWGQDSRYAENLIRMPKTFLCFDDIKTKISLEPPCKENNFITFAFTNSSSKLNTFLLEKVKILLDNFKDSQIVFRYDTYVLFKPSKWTPSTPNYKVTQLCQQVGIDLERVTFNNSWDDEYLLSYHDYDITLSSTPYAGTTTTFETLWMGVPVISFPMLEAHRAYVTNMILLAGKGEIDTSEWIVYSDEQLLKIVRKIADVDYLTNCRKNLRAQMMASPLGDAKLFAENFAKAMRFAWEDKAKRQSVVTKAVDLGKGREE